MKLEEIVRNQTFKLLQGTLACEIGSIVYDSRQAKPGSLFVCIKGFQTDGHLYVHQAVELGAVAVMLEEEIALPDHLTVVQSPDTRKALSAAASVFNGLPSQHLDLVGVTGTNGKTTVTYLVKEILNHAGKKTGLIGTITNWIGDRQIQTIRTTPESVDFQRLLKQMVCEQVAVCVMEVSSHSLALERVNHTEFHTGVFTNLTEDHLDFHASMEAYYQEKKRLFTMTKHNNLLNIDDEYGRRMAEELRSEGYPIITYGMSDDSDLQAMDAVLTLNSVSFYAKGLEMDRKVTLHIPGKFSVYNALAAIGATRSLGIAPDRICEALKVVGGVPGRLEQISEFTSFGVVVDYAHTPDALENVLNTIRQFTENRIITVFGCGGDRDKIKRPLMGKISGELSDISILTSDNPRSEDPMEILRMIEMGIRETKGAYQVIENRKNAIKEALLLAKSGDVVLIAGKGHETTQTIGHVTTHFDDREVARSLAREAGIHEGC
ncbi:UDP-N-acetylmuramoyl-L-alanyl-D-glutamate--2,6-diaminopimelate ligase [Anoxynatronum sibiricum]|uniref:UDP-N-acetylmuramoyl-L-alanyl-D-glutamate--2,6-diaminopimelate ligase n=1 Tax=Anoxynatronum sibiricum TaxID=210623 RepID=A0ABU9VQT5_9CLOT